MDWEWGIETLKRELCARIIGIKKKNMFLFCIGKGQIFRGVSLGFTSSLAPSAP